MLWWTRLALGGATRAMGPYTLRDSQVIIRDEVFDGVTTRVYVPKSENRTSDGAVIFIHGGGFVVGEISRTFLFSNWKNFPSLFVQKCTKR
jgi:acetyl esterase/lipase